MSYDADKENMYVFIILLLILSIFLAINFSLYIFSQGCKIVIGLDFTFICLMVILETVELAFRVNSNYDSNKDSILIRTSFNINRLLRVLMVHRRLVYFSTIISIWFSKYIRKVDISENKQGKNHES